MEFSKLLEERRSIRAFAKDTKISNEDIGLIIYAAQQAPSWKNSQTGRYYAVISSDMVEKFRKNCLPSFNAERTENAAGVIVTSFKRGVSGFVPNGEQADSNGDAWGAYDLGLQNQNLILKARELGYDTLIMGLKDEEKIRELLNIPTDENIMSVIAIGKREVTPEKPVRKAIADILKIY